MVEHVAAASPRAEEKQTPRHRHLSFPAKTLTLPAIAKCFALRNIGHCRHGTDRFKNEATGKGYPDDEPDARVKSQKMKPMQKTC